MAHMNTIKLRGQAATKLTETYMGKKVNICVTLFMHYNISLTYSF